MAIAAAAIAATAWLTTRSTTNQIENQEARTLDIDNRIRSRLVDYAWAHQSWNQVDEVVRRLAEQHGRRIALTTADGEIIVDSAQLLGDDAGPLARVAAALIDPFTADDSQAGWSTDVPFPDVSTEVVAVGDGDRAAYPFEVEGRELGYAVLSSGTALTLTDTALLGSDIVIPPTAYRLSADEIAARRQAASEVMQCARELGLQVRVTDVRSREPSIEIANPSPKAQAFVEKQCMNPRSVLRQPGDRYTDVVKQIDDAIKSCRKDAPAGGSASAGGTETSKRKPKPTSAEKSLFVAEAVPMTTPCEVKAARRVLDDYVASPALLYLGSGEPQRGTLAAFGRSDTIIALAAVFGLALVATVLVGRRILRPVHSITNAAERMASGDRSARVDARGSDELTRLAATFNTMADSVSRTERQHKAMVSDVAHELRNPLANVRGHLEAAQDDVIPTDDRLVTSLLEEATVLQHLIDDLQDLALAESGRMTIRPELIDLRRVVAQSIDAHRTQAATAGVMMTIEGDERTPIMADPKRLRQAVGNLVANALRYTPAGGTVTVRIDRRQDDGHRWLTIAVADTGAGIELEHLTHVFDRFYRADDSRSRETGGTGLGLAIVRHLVEVHGGHIAVDSVVGAGSVFTIYLPRDTDAVDEFDQSGRVGSSSSRR